MEWLASADDRLGSTRFEHAAGEMYRRKRLGLAPGDVTISLHPVLVDDDLLLRHTLVHELLHAAGITDHGSRHAELVSSIAPAPRLADSLVLQYLQAGVIAASDELSWQCTHCGHAWTRNKVRKPQRCPACEHLF